MYRFILLVWILVSLCHTKAWSQHTSFVKNFNAQLINHKIHLSWYTRAGFTCNDIHIKLSSDSIQKFNTVGSIYGVCGDTAEKYYTYTIDAPLKNSTNFIKLELGIFGYSELISIYVFDTKRLVSIKPHPLQASSRIYFNNELKEKTVLSFYSSLGTSFASTTTTEDFIELNTIPLPRGTSFYIIQVGNSTIYRGKLVGQ